MTKGFITSLFLLLAVVISAQDVLVTVENRQEVSMNSLDFKTTLDQFGIDQAKSKGISVDVMATRTSAQGTSYECILRSVTRQNYDSFNDGWKIRLSNAQTINTQQKGQEEFLSEFYQSLLEIASHKALPIALAMSRKLGPVSKVKLVDYQVSQNPLAQHPYSRIVSAKVAVEYATKI